MKTAPLAQYRSAVRIWVEDQLTHDVLKQLWSDMDMDMDVQVGNGKAGALHMVRSVPRSARGKVFAVLDADFEDGNESEWASPDCKMHRLPVHEFENLLLDFEILSQLSGVESAEAIEARAKLQAERLVYWMACKAVLREMQRALGAHFPGDPPQSVNSLESAAKHLQEKSYWADHAVAWNRWSESGTRLAALQQAEARLRDDLQSGAWRQTFSGKEIFRYLRSNVPKLDATPKRPPEPTPTDHDLNLAKRIAAAMQERGCVPAVLDRLREALRRKAAA
jgi:hypothetical protein